MDKPSGDSHAVKTDSPNQLVDHRPRNPATFVAVAFVIGILCDHWFSADWAVWLSFAVIGVAAWCVGRWFEWHRFSAAVLLLAFAGLGAARHHQYRSVVRQDDISRFGKSEQVLVVLTGRVIRSPVIIPKKSDVLQAAWPQPDQTFALLDCESIRTGNTRSRNESESVSGTVRLQVSGHLLHVEAGDRIEVRGWLTQPSGPRNPGQTDFRDRLQRSGVRCIVYVGHPDAVTRLSRPSFSVRRSIGRLRNSAEELLVRNLSGRELSVASAILLGDRTHFDSDLRASFVHSGMMHLLTISGLHVAILAGFVWVTARSFGLPVAATTAVVLFVVVCYGLITDARPSIVRATVMIVVVCIGQVTSRRVSMWNSLSVAALVILLWNPTDLFHAGAQLSFLSVMGMIAAGVWKRDTVQPSPEPVPRFGFLGRGARFAGKWLIKMIVTMAFIWIYTVPMVVARFHVVSPIGLLVNIVLIHFVVVVLSCGYLLLFGGLLFPALEPVFALLFDGSLRMMLGIVDWGATVRMGHFYAPGPPDWWLAAYYGLLAAAAIRPFGKRFHIWGWSAVCVWVIAGLSLGLSPPRHSGLRCTFLSMGHGVGVLIETPDGKTLLYDAGSIGNGNRATRTVQSALWTRHRSRIDAAVISHADLDHLNGMPGILKTVPVGTMFVTQSFLDFRQKPVVVVCDTARKQRVPLRIVRQGDVLKIDPNVTLRVLHAPAQSLDSDNANSIVLEITYAGRRVLLTGDLEKDGLQQLLSQKSREVDVLLSPHHGSPIANPKTLADWAAPNYVVISGGRKTKLAVLRETYAKSKRVFSTHHDGAVTVEIAPDGQLTVMPFLRQ